MKKITLEQRVEICTSCNEYVDGVYAVAGSTLFQVESCYGGKLGESHIVTISDATDAHSPKDLSSVIEDETEFEGMRETEYFQFETREQALAHYFDLHAREVRR